MSKLAEWLTHLPSSGPSAGLRASAVLVVLGLVVSGISSSPWVAGLCRSHLDGMRAELEFLKSGVRAETMVVLQILAAVAGLVALQAHWLAGWGGLLVACFGPKAWLRRARARRVVAIEQQIEGWMGALGRALEAAPSLGEALSASAAMTAAPLRDELEQAENEMKLGKPLVAALGDLKLRVGSRTLALSLAALEVGQATGGRLPEILRRTADSLREMARLEGVLRTKTAEGRSQALVISAMPVPLYLGVRASDPTYFVPLETTPMGHLLLALALLLWIAAGWVARRILAVEL